MKMTNESAVISSSNSSCFRLCSRQKSLRTHLSLSLPGAWFANIRSCRCMCQNCSSTIYTTMLQAMKLTKERALISSSNSSCFRLSSKKTSLRMDKSVRSDFFLELKLLQVTFEEEIAANSWVVCSHTARKCAHSEATWQFNKPTNYANVYSSACMRMCDLVSSRALFEQKRNTPQLISQWNDKLVRSDFCL